MKKEFSSSDLFDALSNIKNELDEIKSVNSVRAYSALYAFLCSASFSVAAALNHLDELEEDVI